MSNSASREPWYLEGRRSVLQRTIRTSVVLAGLGFLAGLAWMIGLDSLTKNNGYVASTTSLYVVPALSSGIAAFVLVMLVGIPYLRCQGHSPGSIAIRCTLMAWIVATPLLGGSQVQDLLNAGCEKFAQGLLDLLGLTCSFQSYGLSN